MDSRCRKCGYQEASRLYRYQCSADKLSGGPDRDKLGEVSTEAVSGANLIPPTYVSISESVSAMDTVEHLDNGIAELRTRAQEAQQADFWLVGPPVP